MQTRTNTRVNKIKCKTPELNRTKKKNLKKKNK